MAKVAQRRTDRGSGTLSTLTLDVEVEEEDDEPEEEEELEEEDELAVELVESRVIVTPEVCETISGGLLTFATLSEKLSTPPAASPCP